MENNMEKRIKALEELGLSKNEAIVYLTLLDLGSSTATKIADKSKLHRTTVYDALDRLTKKGLVSYIEKEETKYFEACDPENLMAIIKQKQDLLTEIIPQLKLSRKLAESKAKAHIYEGMEGVKASMEKALVVLKEGDKILCFGIPKRAPDMMSQYFDRFHKRRIEKKISMIHLYNENARERIAYLKSLPLTEAGYLPKEYDSPASTLIYGNIVCLTTWSEIPFVVMIESQRVADAYSKYFWLLWSLAKK